MTPQVLVERLKALGPETQVTVTDLTGTQDHYKAEVQSPLFCGKTMLEQHRMVFACVQQEIDSGEIHALSLRTEKMYAGKN